MTTRRTNTSGRTGVHYSTVHAKWGKPWIAAVTINYKHHHLGCYHTYEQAVARREQWETDNPDVIANRYHTGPLPGQRIPYVLTPKAIAALDGDDAA